MSTSEGIIPYALDKRRQRRRLREPRQAELPPAAVRTVGESCHVDGGRVRRAARPIRVDLRAEIDRALMARPRQLMSAGH